MAVSYMGQSNTPVYKFRSSLSATTAVAAWTPTTSTQIAVTDITCSAAAAGTIQLRFGNVGGDVFAEFITAGSVTVGRSYETPVLSGVYDREIYMEAGMNGYVSVALQGFERS